MNRVKVAAIQMLCGICGGEFKKAEAMVRKAAAEGANVILLPELFEREYFCQQRRYDFYHYAKPVMENDAVRMGMRLAAELGVVLPISFYERDVNNLYNSIACIDADGTVLGVYRKTHIPDDHYYRKSSILRRGIPDFGYFLRATAESAWESAGISGSRRARAAWHLRGRSCFFYPTAIGSEPILECDSMPHWRRCMQGHAAANLMPVIAANRIGEETVEPCEENGGQRSALVFYGSSFPTDETGEILTGAGRDEEEILVQEYDLDELDARRLEWGLFRDRRPECYGIISGR